MNRLNKIFFIILVPAVIQSQAQIIRAPGQPLSRPIKSGEISKKTVRYLVTVDEDVTNQDYDINITLLGPSADLKEILKAVTTKVTRNNNKTKRKRVDVEEKIPFGDYRD